MRRFEYDPQKSVSNQAKHGIDFIEAQKLREHRTFEQPAHFRGEMRYAVTGMINAKFWTAVVTYRGAVIRIISVRLTVGDEIRIYEQKFKLGK